MLREEMHERFIQWWKDLQEDSGGRAQLRRCNSLVEVVLHPEMYRLKRVLPNWISLEVMAILVGLGAHIKENISYGFAESLATPKDKNGRIPFSESRFRQLLSSRDWEELYRNIRRAILILEGKVNLISFFDMVMLWNDEFNESHKKIGRGVRYKLSHSYYDTVMKYEKHD